MAIPCWREVAREVARHLGAWNLGEYTSFYQLIKAFSILHDENGIPRVEYCKPYLALVFGFLVEPALCSTRLGTNAKKSAHTNR